MYALRNIHYLKADATANAQHNAAGPRSNQNIYFLFLAGGQKKIMEGWEGCQGMTCGNMPKITEYLPLK